MPHLKFALVGLGLAGLVLSLPEAAAQAPRSPGRTLLVVVNLKRPEADLTLHELSRLFRGEQRFWNNGDRAYPVLPPEDLPDARATFLASVAKLDQRGFTLHWRNLVFRGDVTDQPISPPDERRAVQSVFAERGAIAIVEGSAIRNLDRVAKILTVNGHVRDDADYPLRW
jgi:ABC-type phosphate transport system substrate-binding protein